ncbi:MAG: amidohydrolase [Bacteroidaceae bacterium]|nr:amidohydrolase [Bacteroidaceae bacterium]
MRITVMQRDIIWSDPAGNLARAEAAIRDIPADTDLIILPEMFSTGFVTQPDSIAEPVLPHPSASDDVTDGQSPTLDWMRRISSQRGCAIAGSIAVSVASSFRNRFYFVKPDGETSYYDKHHLFTYGNEDKHYTAGQKRTIIEWRGVRFLPMICYDLRFPVWSRNHEDYDVAIYVASWPTSRIKAWETLLHARAIENQCFVVGVNRVGSDPNCNYCGCSAIIDPYGRDIASCPPDEESEITSDLDLAALQAFRQKFPVLKDRDREREDGRGMMEEG